MTFLIGVGIYILVAIVVYLAVEFYCVFGSVKEDSDLYILLHIAAVFWPVGVPMAAVIATLAITLMLMGRFHVWANAKIVALRDGLKNKEESDGGPPG